MANQVEALTKAAAAAKAAYKANKSDKSLKKASKEAKAALAAEVARVEEKKAKKAKKAAKKRSLSESTEAKEEQPATKKVKVEDVTTLTAEAAKAKAAYKANKDDKALKKVWKDLKAKIAALEATSSTETPAEEKVEEKVEEPVVADDTLASLKKNNDSEAPAAPKYNNGSDGSNPPSAKVFVGNLPWSVDDDFMKDYFKECGSIENISWLMDKETDRFKGCGFLVFESIEAATKACGMNEQDCGGRNIRINYAKDRNNARAGGGGGRAAKALSEKPEGCIGVFVGNLSYDIQDENVHEMAKGAGCGDIAKIRWLTDRETGDFKGCGFIDFYDTADVDLFVKKNGSDLLGRNIRIDYATPRAQR